MSLLFRGFLYGLVPKDSVRMMGFSWYSRHYSNSSNVGAVKRHFRQRTFTSESRRLPIIYLFTKEDCSLCDEAKAKLKHHSHRFILEEVDITLPENEPWYEMYKYDIPVFHMFEDFLFKHRVDLDVLEKALTDFENKNKSANT